MAARARQMNDVAVIGKARAKRPTRRSHKGALTAARLRPKAAPTVRDAHSLEEQALDLAVIGNCRIAALVNPTGRIVWWCFPRFDSDPVFSRLLAGDEEKGFTDVVLERMATTESHYVRNTAIVGTTLTAADGAAVRVPDFAPRFRNFGRISRPPQLMRIIEPIAGM